MTGVVRWGAVALILGSVVVCSAGEGGRSGVGAADVRGVCQWAFSGESVDAGVGITGGGGTDSVDNVGVIVEAAVAVVIAGFEGADEGRRVGVSSQTRGMSGRGSKDGGEDSVDEDGSGEGGIGSEGSNSKQGGGNGGSGKVEDKGGVGRVGDAGGIARVAVAGGGVGVIVAQTRGQRGVSEVGGDGLYVVEVEVSWMSKRRVLHLVGACRAVMKNGRKVVS